MEDFAKLCGLLRIYELYWKSWFQVVSDVLQKLAENLGIDGINMALVDPWSPAPSLVEHILCSNSFSQQNRYFHYIYGWLSKGTQ